MDYMPRKGFKCKSYFDNYKTKNKGNEQRKN